MAQDDFDQDDRTEQPTAHHRREEREKGRVAQSRELSSVAVFFSGFVGLAVFGPRMLETLMRYLRETFASIGSAPSVQEVVYQRIGAGLLVLVRLLLPFFLTLAVVVIIVHVAQTGVHFTMKPLIPNFSKLRPAVGFGRIASMQSAVHLLINLVKMVIIGRIGYLAIIEIIPELVTLQDMEVGEIVAFSGQVVMRLAVKVGIMFFLLALFDYAYQRWEYEKSLRMTKQEVKEEMKRFEGNPRMKQHMRSMQMSLSRQRMLKQVPEADVVITNPTHFAVAVKYDLDKMSAPRVVAKGARLIAERIKLLAAQHNVPVVENKPLAQALFKTVDVGQEIPEKLYQAVAEILAYVYQLNRSRLKGAAGRIKPQAAY